MENNKQVVRLTEEQLHFIVENAVQDALLQEGFWDMFKGGAQAAGQMLGRGAQNVGNQIGNAARTAGKSISNKANQFKQGAQQFGQNVANQASQAMQGVQQFGQNVGNTIKAGAANSNYQAAKNKAIEALDAYLKVAQGMPGGMNDNTFNAVKQAKIALTRAGGARQASYQRKMNKMW